MGDMMGFLQFFSYFAYSNTFCGYFSMGF